ncbi:SlyX protein [Pseudoduganella sp. FT25W]|jgi:SlyX protein|uniref:SlyX protein n=1 Tax=Duganella alba TaxID=2666081 RepID=A0A6L5QHK4_9BURK|nr:SlyX family protein [Duganella alba]MRX09283.1 SlyX protein [Duganella alba]MRX17195.1 SlyX protein [Duganella alba]
MNTEDRFIELEIKLAHQEHVVETLNQRVYEQQQQIDKLEQLCGLLVQRVRESAQGGSGGQLPHERPPHY